MIFIACHTCSVNAKTPMFLGTSLAAAAELAQQ